MSPLERVLELAPDVLRIKSAGDFFGIAINVAMGTGIVVSVVFIVLAGIRFSTSHGNPKAVDQARKALTYAIIALALTLGSVAFKYIVLNSILGVRYDMFGKSGGHLGGPKHGGDPYDKGKP